MCVGGRGVQEMEPDRPSVRCPETPRGSDQEAVAYDSVSVEISSEGQNWGVIIIQPIHFI